MEKKLISIKEAAEMLGVSKLTLRNWDRDGKLCAFRNPISNYRVYNREDIEKLLEQIHSGAKPAVVPRKKKSDARTLTVIHLKD